MAAGTRDPRQRGHACVEVGANRVSPREIEDVIAEVAGVAEVCVAGVPDELLGEAVEAFVVVAPGADVSPEHILAHCREYLALYKVPRGVHFRDSLPRGGAGKVLRSELVRTV